jgi:hypothetical protein
MSVASAQSRETLAPSRSLADQLIRHPTSHLSNDPARGAIWRHESYHAAGADRDVGCGNFLTRGQQSAVISPCSATASACHEGGIRMAKHRVFAMKFAKVYPLYVKKAESKNRTKKEIDQIICWLTGYDQAGLQQQIEQENDFETFFAQAPAMNPNRSLIKGVVCGVRVEEIKDPLMKKLRYLDILIDELAKGKTMAKILRSKQEADTKGKRAKKAK